MNIQDWFPLGLTGVISLQSKGLSRVVSKTSILQHPAFFMVQLSHPYMTTSFLSSCNFKETHSKREEEVWKSSQGRTSKQRGVEDKVPCHNPEDYPLGTQQGRSKEARKKAATQRETCESNLWSWSRGNWVYWEVEPLYCLEERSDKNMSLGTRLCWILEKWCC